MADKSPQPHMVFTFKLGYENIKEGDPLRGGTFEFKIKRTLDLNTITVEFDMIALKRRLPKDVMDLFIGALQEGRSMYDDPNLPKAVSGARDRKN